MFDLWGNLLSDLNANNGNNNLPASIKFSQQLNDNAISVLNQQNAIDTIITQETDYLDKELSDVSTSVAAAQRTLMLNESVRLRTQDYNMILYYFILLIVIVNVMVIMNRMFPLVSEGMLYFLIIITIAVFLYFIIRTLIMIYNRDNIDYSKLDFPNPTNVNLPVDSIIAQNKINNKNIPGQGIMYDLPPQQCPPAAAPATTMKSGFTLMDDSQAEPNGDYEFRNYSPF